MFTLPSVAQNDELVNSPIEFGGRVIVALPGYANSSDLNMGFGVGGNLGYKFINNPHTVVAHHWSAGINVDYIWYGGTQNKVGIYDINIISNAYGFSPYTLFEFKPHKEIGVYGVFKGGFYVYDGTYIASWRTGNSGTGTSSDRQEFKDVFHYQLSAFTGLGGGLRFRFLELRFMANFGTNINMVDTRSFVLDANGRLSRYSTKPVNTNTYMVCIGFRIW
jgi:hypothetical protein